MNVHTIALFVACCLLMHQVIASEESGGGPLAACSLPRVTGPCRASITRYGYDPVDESCVSFIYGGCEGNDNNFRTVEECESACGASHH